MVCYHEISYEQDDYPMNKLVHSEEFGDEEGWEVTNKGRFHTKFGGIAMLKAKRHIPPQAEVVEVRQYCDDELLEVLEESYRDIE